MYYFFTQNLVDEEGMAEITGHTEISGQYLWTAGKKFKEPMPLQVLELDTSDGENMPDFFDTTIPVISKELVKSLTDIGVDNFDIYPVILKNLKAGEEHENYVAINFLGSVDAVDQDESEYELDAFDEPDYESVVIDAKKAKGFKAFRLLTGSDFLVINQEVATFIKAKNFKGIMISETVDLENI